MALPRIYARDDGIICTDWGPNARLTVEKVRYALSERLRISGGKPSLLLTLGQHVVDVEYEVQPMVTSEEFASATLAHAVVVGDFLSRHLAKLFQWYHRPLHPFKVFEDETAAIEWLKAHAAVKR